MLCVETVKAADLSLLGREESTDRLRRALAELGTGRGGCVVVEGSAGIGKTKFLEHVADQAQREGVRVQRGRATELDSSLPLAALRGMFRTAGGTGVGPLFRVRRDGEVHDLVEEVVARIADWAGGRPALVALDDAHWVDEVTAHVLRAVIRDTRSRPVLWMLTRCPVGGAVPAKAMLDLIVREGAELLVLPPLSRAVVRRMCAQLLRAEPDEAVLMMAERCGGSPYLLEKLLTAALKAEVVRVEGGRAFMVEFALPGDFVDAVERYLEPLSERARRILTVASVLNRPFTLHEVAKLSGCGIPGSLPVVKEVIDASVLADDGVRLAFRHELVREALYEGLPAALRAALHREAAGLGRSEGVSPVESIEHLIRSGQAEAEALGVLLRQAVEETADHDPVPRDRAFAPGRSAEPVRGASPGSVRVPVARAPVEAPRPQQANDVSVELLATKAQNLVRLYEFAAGEQLAPTAGGTGERMTRAAQLCTRAALADVARGRGRLDLSLVLAREAVQLAERIGRESLAHHPRLQFCQTATALDLFDEARAVAEQGRRIVSAVGGAWSHPQYHLVLAELHLAAGRLDDARSTAEAGLATSADRRAPQAVMPLLALLARLALRCDAPEAAAELLHEADRVAARQGEHGHELAFARAEYWAALDRAVDGFEAVEAMYPSLVAWPLPLVQEPLVAMRLLDLARRARRPEEAWSVVTAVKAVAARNPRSRSLNGVAAHVDALHRGDTAALRQAVHLLRGTPRPLVLAAALEDLALAERDDGRHEPAARLLAEAEELHRHAASARDRERVAALRQGLTGSPAGGTADSTAWDSLTPSELRVVRFVAQGLTNREVAQRLSVSRHTVDSHLRHTFTKLGVGNRVELTRIFLAREGAISNGAVT